MARLAEVPCCQGFRLKSRLQRVTSSPLHLVTPSFTFASEHAIDSLHSTSAILAVGPANTSGILNHKCRQCNWRACRIVLTTYQKSLTKALHSSYNMAGSGAGTRPDSLFFRGWYCMARKKSAPRRDWRMVVFIIISLVIVLSMVLAYLPGVLSGPY